MDAMIMPLAQVNRSVPVISRSEATRDLVLIRRRTDPLSGEKARFLLTSFVEMTVAGCIRW